MMTAQLLLVTVISGGCDNYQENVNGICSSGCNTALMAARILLPGAMAQVTRFLNTTVALEALLEAGGCGSTHNTAKGLTKRPRYVVHGKQPDHHTRPEDVIVVVTLQLEDVVVTPTLLKAVAVDEAQI